MNAPPLPMAVRVDLYDGTCWSSCASREQARAQPRTPAMRSVWLLLLRPTLAGAAALALAGAALAQKALEAYEHLAKPAFQTAYLNALGSKAKIRWLARRDGPAPMPSYQDVAGERYVMNSFCKPHDCADHNAVFLYAPDKGFVYGTIYEKGRTTLVGKPPPAVADALAALWKKEWRPRPG